MLLAIVANRGSFEAYRGNSKNLLSGAILIDKTDFIMSVCFIFRLYMMRVRARIGN